MKIEITVEGQEPTVHKLTKEKTLLGGGQDCDITVTAEGISRKHLMIIAENDQYFVVDQGSTNGSFINEDRMVPGQRTGFTSFFPVKMGFYVTVALLSDDEGGGSFDFAKTLNKSSEPAKPKAAAGTKTDIQTPRGRSSGGGTSPKITLQKNPKDKKQRPGAPGKRSSKTAEESGSQSVKILAFIIAVGGTLGLWYLTKEEEIPVETTQNIVAEVKPSLNLAELTFTPPELVGTESFSSAFSDQKCIVDNAQLLCQEMGLPHGNFRVTGVVYNPTTVVLVLPQMTADEYFDLFKPVFFWTDNLRYDKPPLADQRDHIALFLSRVKPATWAQLSEERRWLYVMFATSTGQNSNEVWVADLLALKQSTQLPSYASSLSACRASGVEALRGIAGFFRKLER